MALDRHPSARVSLRVQPGSSRDVITRLDSGFRVRVTATAVDGKANARLVELLAKAVDVPKSAVVIERGSASRTKLVRVSGIDQVELERRLTEAAARDG